MVTKVCNNQILAIVLLRKKEKYDKKVYDYSNSNNFVIIVK